MLPFESEGEIFLNKNAHEHKCFGFFWMQLRLQFLLKIYVLTTGEFLDSEVLDVLLILS